MKSEIEIKFINIDKEKIRLKLHEIYAKLDVEERLMRRKTFDFANISLKPGEYKWMRVRDEGDKVTLNMKHIINEKTIDGTKEIEIKVDNFDQTCELLLEMNMIETNYQENYRESWIHHNNGVTIDTWPGIGSIIEIEGESEESVKETTIALGFNYSDGLFSTVDYVYQKMLEIPAGELVNIKKLTFENYKDVLKNYLK